MKAQARKSSAYGLNGLRWETWSPLSGMVRYWQQFVAKSAVVHPHMGAMKVDSSPKAQDFVDWERQKRALFHTKVKPTLTGTVRLMHPFCIQQKQSVAVLATGPS
eukprot:56841-Amphidinium_carterae.2